MLNYDSDEAAAEEDKLRQALIEKAAARRGDLHPQDEVFSALAPALRRSICDCGFEQASAVQAAILPALNAGLNVACDTKSALGKTTAICIAALQHVETKARLGWSPARHRLFSRETPYVSGHTHEFRDSVVTVLLCSERARQQQGQRRSGRYSCSPARSRSASLIGLPVELLCIIFEHLGWLDRPFSGLLPARGSPLAVMLAPQDTDYCTYQLTRELRRFSRHSGVVCTPIGQDSRGKLWRKDNSYAEHYANFTAPSTTRALPLTLADRSWVQQFLAERDPHVVVGTPAVVARLAAAGVLQLEGVRFLGVDARQAQSFVAIAPGGTDRACIDEILERIPRAKLQTVVVTNTHREFDAARLKRVCAGIMPPNRRTGLFSEAEEWIHGGVAWQILDTISDPVKVDGGLKLRGLQQHYVKLTDAEKNRKLFDLLDSLNFDQVVIFDKSVAHCKALEKLLAGQNLPAVAIHGGMRQPERFAVYQQFKAFEKRILVATDIVGCGMDFERVNVVINYDMPGSSNEYLHRVAASGVGTKGLVISFVSDQEAATVLEKVGERLETNIAEMPATIQDSVYNNTE